VPTEVTGLPTSITNWIEEVTTGTVSRAVRVPGGASREAWFVDVDLHGTFHALFLRYDPQPQGGDSPFWPLRIEGEIFQALYGTGVTVPRTLAVHPTEAAILAERVPGATWFSRITDPDEQVRTAQDFIRNLAALHRLDPRELRLPSLGPVKSPREHALDEIANMRRRASRSDGSMLPHLRVALDWLAANVPAYEGPTVFVQGDTGPGNFMYQGCRVTAVVDWELAHFGDPMDDIAWLSLRTVQDTFTHLPDRLREYEALSGFEIDEDRVWYYRLFAELRLATHGLGTGVRSLAADAAKGRDAGNSLIYGTLHRRQLVEALARAFGVPLERVDMANSQPPGPGDDVAEAALAMLRNTTERISDPLAMQWTKSTARLVKYLQQLDRHGGRLRQAELDDLAGLLRTRPPSLDAGRRQLAELVETDGIDRGVYVGYLWRQTQRDDVIARTASGVLATRTWPPLR
jgi:aminoglycoside phosphotransferase (APT) family kinase protein